MGGNGTDESGPTQGETERSEMDCQLTHELVDYYSPLKRSEDDLRMKPWRIRERRKKRGKEEEEKRRAKEGEREGKRV